MKVKIKKCSLDTYWYANRIGEEFEVEDFASTENGPIDSYMTIKKVMEAVEPYSGHGAIDLDDCEVITEL